MIKNRNTISITILKNKVIAASFNNQVLGRNTFTEYNFVFSAVRTVSIVILNNIISVTNVENICVVTCSTIQIIVTLTADKYIIAAVAVNRILIVGAQN